MTCRKIPIKKVGSYIKGPHLSGSLLSTHSMTKINPHPFFSLLSASGAEEGGRGNLSVTGNVEIGMAAETLVSFHLPLFFRLVTLGTPSRRKSVRLLPWGEDLCPSSLEAQALTCKKSMEFSKETLKWIPRL